MTERISVNINREFTSLGLAAQYIYESAENTLKLKNLRYFGTLR